MEKSKTIGALITGTLIGAGLGILFAPKKGSETREDIKKECKKLTKKMKEIDKQDITEFIEEAKEEIEQELKELSKEKVLSKARDKANEIRISCDEILEMATVAGNEALEEATKQFKDKTVKVLKDIIKKLEA